MKPNKAWLHNSAIGYTKGAIKQLRRIQELSTLTPAAMRAASAAISELENLFEELQKKKDD